MEFGASKHIVIESAIQIVLCAPAVLALAPCLRWLLEMVVGSNMSLEDEASAAIAGGESRIGRWESEGVMVWDHNRKSHQYLHDLKRGCRLPVWDIQLGAKLWRWPDPRRQVSHGPRARAFLR